MSNSSLFQIEIDSTETLSSRKYSLCLTVIRAAHPYLVAPTACENLKCQQVHLGIFATLGNAYAVRPEPIILSVPSVMLNRL